MRLIRRFVGSPVEILFVACVAVGCSGGKAPGGGSSGGEGGAAGETEPEGTGGSRSGGTGGRGSGGSGGSADRDAASITPDADNSSTSDAGPMADAASGGKRDGGGLIVDSSTPMNVDGQPLPSYNGEIPLYYGPEVAPIVEMNCPGDPTEGWTEYQDSFHVEHPYTLPTNTRFSITGGIYNFWVFPNDAPHSPNAQGRNPRTEARYGGTADVATGKNFQHGQRMFSADMLVERNAVGSAVMQIHTTATGGGPIGIRIQSNSDVINNGSLKVVDGSTVPGGLIDKWFNYKASLDADTLEVNIYINNCLKKTYKGDRGDGNFYFKHGVYFCKTSQNGCFSHYKNIHLYKK
jgi:alginate lyase